MKKTNFKNLVNTFSVSKHAKIFALVPFVLLLIALIVIVSLGATSGSYTDAVGIGIDFEGGTVLTVTLGKEAEDNFAKNRDELTDVINDFGVVVSYARLQRANNAENSSIEFRYKNISNNDDEINELNNKIIDAVVEHAGINREAVKYESIGATAANDLLRKAGIALAVSVAIILVYIIIRFTLMSGFAAIIALIHDVVIMFVLTVICRVQINSSYVAAMITIIAYSINNTIIIFDRCRESMKNLKTAGVKTFNYTEIGDEAVRATFTRSVYTTITTMVTVIFLAILGSDTLREFCVPIILGLIAGLYSSVFLATPLWAAMSASFDRTKAKYFSRNKVTYSEKREDEEVVEAQVKVTETDEIKPKEVKQAGQKPEKKQPVRYSNPKKAKKKNDNK